MLGFKRRRFLVEGLQYRMMGAYFLYLFAIVMVFYGAIFLPLVFTLDSGSLPDLQRDEAATQILSLHSRVWLSLPIILAFCMMHSVLVSHRIAGPLYRFKRIFKSMGEGDLSFKVKLRRPDYLWNEARAINDMATRLSGKIETLRSHHRETSRTLDALTQALGQHRRDEASALVERLDARLDLVSRELRQFRTASDIEWPPPAPAESPTPELVES